MTVFGETTAGQALRPQNRTMPSKHKQPTDQHGFPFFYIGIFVPLL